jgi:cold shock protein
MALGTVNGSIAKKGFGFDDGGNDAFVQVSAVERAGLSDLAEGQKLSFEIKVDTKRRKSSSLYEGVAILCSPHPSNEPDQTLSYRNGGNSCLGSSMNAA